MCPPYTLDLNRVILAENLLMWAAPLGAGGRCCSAAARVLCSARARPFLCWPFCRFCQSRQAAMQVSQAVGRAAPCKAPARWGLQCVCERCRCAGEAKAAVRCLKSAPPARPPRGDQQRPPRPSHTICISQRITTSCTRILTGHSAGARPARCAGAEVKPRPRGGPQPCGRQLFGSWQPKS